MSNPTERESANRETAAHAPAPVTEPHKASASPAPSAAQVDRVAAAATKAPSGGSGLAVPPVIDLGDLERGERTVHDVHVYNLDPTYNASTFARIEGHPSIKVIDYPDYLPPSHDTAGAGTRPIRLELRPNADPVIAGRLEIGARWNMNARPDEVRAIPVVAVTHAGKRTVREQAEIDKTAREDRATADADAAQRKDAEAGIDAYHEREKLGHHEGHLAKLDGQRQAFQGALTDLANKRKLGVEAAARDIGEFKRKAPVPKKTSLVESLAWAALDMVTGPMASAAGTGAAMAVEHLVSKGVANKVVSSAVKDGVKGLVKKVLTTLVEDGKPKDDPSQSHSVGDSSHDAKNAFISLQGEAAWGGANTHAVRTSQFLANHLRATVLDAHPEAAFAVLSSATSAVNAEKDLAASNQRSATLQQWTRYLAQATMGSVQGVSFADGTSLTNMAAAAHAPDESRRQQTFDGLIDLTFTVDELRPETPAQATKMAIRGVRRKVAIELASKSISSLRLPLRASAEPSSHEGVPRVAVTPIAITRDEAGNYGVVDNMRLPWEAPSWLSRKAGIHKPSAAAQEAGARKLLEQEIRTLPKNANIVTDGED